MLVIGIFLVLFVGLSLSTLLLGRRREKAMAELAMQHGWTPIADPTTLQQYLPRYLQGLGQNDYNFSTGFTRSVNSFDMAYQVDAGSGSTVFFQYVYTEYYFEFDSVTNQERETSKTHTFTVLHTALTNTVPSILLLHHSLLSKLTTIGEHSGLQSLSLEGDFNKTFDTYIMPNGQIEALSLLTPDTMEMVTNVGQGASVQLLGQTLVLSAEAGRLTPSSILLLLDGIGKLAANIDSKPQSELLPDR